MSDARRTPGPWDKSTDEGVRAPSPPPDTLQVFAANAPDGRAVFMLAGDRNAWRTLQWLLCALYVIAVLLGFSFAQTLAGGG